MGVRRLVRAKVIVAVVAAAALVAAGIVLAVALSQPTPLTIRNVRIPVVDGPQGNQHVVIDASFFTPPGGGRLPAVLLAHGLRSTTTTLRPRAWASSACARPTMPAPTTTRSAESAAFWLGMSETLAP